MILYNDSSSYDFEEEHRDAFKTLIILDLVTFLKKVLIVFITNKNTGYQHVDDKPC